MLVVPIEKYSNTMLVQVHGNVVQIVLVQDLNQTQSGHLKRMDTTQQELSIRFLQDTILQHISMQTTLLLDIL